MKTLHAVFILVFLSASSLVSAQQQYTVDGQTYVLKTEVEGPLTLLWNTIDGEYRYFSKKGTTIAELKNTRLNGTYQEEYKDVLATHADDVAISFADTNLTLSSLSDFFVAYNKRKDPEYTFDKPDIKLDFRLGGFFGITNNPYVSNPENTTTPSFGVDLEIIDEVRLRRHAALLRFKQTLSTSDYSYSSSQLSLNYRFKFIKTERIDVFLNTKIVAYTYSSNEVEFVTTGPADEPILNTVEETGGSFQAPGAFGIGADVALGNGYLTFSYNDIVAIGVDGNGETPLDFTLGYKFNL
ncbi:hypothetical protein [Cochleicola gelatinilyticus]|uniref:Outer membrane protein beta-barrel domain-containing protein n=1 Tax=Cochleicola gelatinilyticus TaxID=1763537 RepID=A0A167IQW7_9FLAO|nr:hypothetical protein [Cochleicola gelatinilyticus]OAB79925.1 hypothetical protein ULVI_04080 [Cochleicola gelatinilyticus]